MRIVATLLVACSLAEAQDRGDEIDAYLADPVIVTALRRPQSAFKAPFASEIVDKKRVLHRQYRTTPQALRDTTGVMVQETSAVR